MISLRQGRCCGLLCRGGLILMVGLQVLTATVCRGDDAAPEVHPPSSWVLSRSFTRPKAEDGVDAAQDYRWLLLDRQINAQSEEEFVHEARQTLTAAGVQYGSHISINYDPTCQTLTLHWARLWRGAAKLERLDPSKIHVSQGGLDTDDFLFSSRKTATLVLDDVRVGDIVDYAYTIEGQSPALGSRYFGEVPLRFAQPVERVMTRLIWPSPRRLYIKNHLTDIQPSRLRKTNGMEFTWVASNVPALRLESPTPVWYDPYPWVQLSEFQTWAEVNRWALRLFTTTNAPSMEMERKIKEWKQLPEPSARILAALRFTQEEVRYLGMEDGAAGYQPVEPESVFARRYGDCKDKSFLLVTLLRALKVQAFPVLVNTRLRRGLAELHPSPVLFDHTIVQVNLDGQSYWLDATANYQRGALAARTWPNYGLGLTVAPGVTALTVIPPCAVQPKTTVSEYLDIGARDYESTVKIVTVAEGSDADRLRERFSTMPREDVERENLNGYARLYPSIRRAAPLVYAEDEQQNRVETTEYYVIDKMWSRLPDEQNYHARIYSVNVDEALVKPAVLFRTMPMGLRFPAHQIFHAEVSMVSGFPSDASNVRIENPAFFFERNVSLVGGKLFLNYEYRSWTDAVMPEAMPAYARDLDTAAEAMGYTVMGF